MKQKRFILNDVESFEKMSDEINKDALYRKCEKCLIQMVVPMQESPFIINHLKFFKENIPKAVVIGMTNHGALSRETHSIDCIICTVLFFEETNFKLDVFDCSEKTPKEVGAEYINMLSERENVRGILMMSSDIKLCPEKFIDQIYTFDERLIVFGALAGSNEMGKNNSIIFAEEKIYDRAILAVSFEGKNLQITADYNLGWKSLGKELTIDKSDDNGVVYQIDNIPAFDVYANHLGVSKNPYFFENISSFPFMIRHNGIYLARIALNYRESGALEFAMELPVGSRVSLGYAKPEYLLAESYTKSREMMNFRPEALLIYSCMNRRMLMGDNLTETEFSYYEDVNPSATWVCGYGEILHTREIRGLLNSTLVAVGMRECDSSQLPEKYQYSERGFYSNQEPIFIEDIKNDEKYKEIIKDLTRMEIIRKEGYIPLNDRLINFLEATTSDLRDAVNMLFKAASLDQLTEIYNRRALDFFIEQAIGNFGIEGRVALVMFDIDFFKKINDNFGHDIGDDIIKQVVNVIKDSSGKHSVLGRWGGEEFILMVKNTSQNDVVNLAEKIRKKVEVTNFIPVGHITISVGITFMDNTDDSVRLFERVDKALYQAKKNGRNCIRIK
ncbi:diguanylate cyclase (GGDEF) domain-containing protein [Lachnospiraceae bacterium C7]|nr:diguanylate cyclase (GGDEF) domain-containing protein [Lachnospiraceae bacterium C7]